MPETLAIDLRQVTKVYKGRVRALDDIEMRVQRGEIFGLLGPNGAGKSTLVKIIMSVTHPTQAVGTVLERERSVLDEWANGAKDSDVLLSGVRLPVSVSL